MAASSTSVETHSVTEEWFLTGFAEQVGMDVGALRRSGTTVAPLDDRAGSGVVAAYRTMANGFDHAVLWTDPANVEPLDLHRFARPETIDLDDLHPVLVDAGAQFVAKATMRVPTGLAPPDQPTVTGRLRWAELDTGNPDHFELILRFVAAIDPADVEEAALDDLDQIHADEYITVLIDPDHGGIVAYAAAGAWDWDPTVLDVGVLVAPDRREAGLGRAAVAQVCAAVVDSGRLPLYRHDRANTASSRLADSLGFRSVVDLAVYQLPTP